MVRRYTSDPRASVREYATGADWSGFQSAVSLHAHTHYSREVMADLPQYLSRIPIVAGLLEDELRVRQESGRGVDFSKGWWHPPLSAPQVFRSEERQVEARFGLMALVSITDHDDIRAGFDLQQYFAPARAPISTEWSVPFGSGYFHLGVHNLPASRAAEWFGRLSAFTLRTSTASLTDLLSELSGEDGVLIVLNHPLWDLAGVGDDEHLRLLQAFLAAHRPTLHAVEVNGYRSRQENGGARTLSLEYNLPLVSGGDRHACAPNAIVNVTRARSFGEFAHEVRDGVSHVVILPEYRRHLATRKLAAAAEVMRRYRTFPSDRQRWLDRVSCEWRGAVRPLSYHWPDGGPVWVRSAVAAFRAITSPAVLPVIGIALDLFTRSAEGSAIPVGIPIETSTGVFRLGL
jgi:hypothetical protein